MTAITYDTQLPMLVYGTLRPGHGNYKWALADKTISETDVVLHGFTMYTNGGFPYLVPGGEGTVVATLIQVPADLYEEVSKDLDMLEGFHFPNYQGNHYDRVLHTFEHNGEVVHAWLYVPERSTRFRVESTLPVVNSGDWNLREYI